MTDDTLLAERLSLLVDPPAAGDGPTFVAGSDAPAVAAPWRRSRS